MTPGEELPLLGLALGLGLVILSVVVAWNVRKLQKTAADYYLAGRNIGVFQNASAICADYISAASFLGVAGLTFLIGFEGLFYAFGFYLGFAMVLFFIAGPLRKFGQYTIPDFVGGRFHSNTGRAVAIACVLVISLFYTAPQVLGSAKILLVLTGIPYPVGVGLVITTITLYVVLGGMRGATMTQILQFWVLWTAIFTVAILSWVGGMSYGKVLTGIDALIPVRTAGAATQPVGGDESGGGLLQPLYPPGEPEREPTDSFLRPGNQLDPVQAFSLLIALMCGTAGLPHVLIRLYTNPDRARARWSVVLVLVFIGSFYLMAPYIGLVMRYSLLAAQTGAGTLGQPELGWLTTNGENLAVAAAALHFGGQIGLGIAVAGALAAVLSTMAGLLVVMSAALGHDLYYSLYNPEADDKTRVLVARGSTLLMGALTFLLALSVEHMQIAVLVGLAFAISASTLFPVLVSGLWWRRMTSSGAVAGMVTGLVVSLFLIFAKPLLPGWLQFQNPGGISVAASFLSIYVVSRVDGRVPADVDRFMALVHGTHEERRLRAAGLLKSRNLFADLRRRGDTG